MSDEPTSWIWGRGRGHGRGYIPQPRRGPREDEEQSIRMTKTRSRLSSTDTLDKHLKVEILNFLGSLNPNDLLEWLRDVERIFEYKGYNDTKAFKVATLKLKGYASLWYDTMKSLRAREGKDPIRSWNKLKKKLLAKFVAKDYTQDLFIRLSKLKQNENSVEAYLRDFEQLTLQCDIIEKPDQRIARFLEGLNYNIAKQVRLQPLWSFEDVVNLSFRVEKMSKETPKSYAKAPPPKPYSGVRIGENSRPPLVVNKSVLDKGKTPMGHKSTPTRDERRKCYKVSVVWAFQKDCPSKRTLTATEVQEWEEEGLVEYEPEEEYGSEKEDDSDKTMVVTPLDTGHNLVLWGVMHSQQQPLEEDQRSLIFRSRCTIQGRVCNVIIDGGSCTNVASVTMVNKLNLETKPHPNPYKLRWLNKGAEVKVDQQCLVPFSIGNTYKDEVTCDIVPMDACHLLLGRPWEFDKDALHKGKSNIYTFKHGNQRIVLTPLPPNTKDYGSPNMSNHKGVLFLSEAEILREMQEEQSAFILLSKEVEGTTGIPSEVMELIHNYQEASLRSDPKTTRELQKQIEELMSKGFVRESLSPCAVPALLVPKKDSTWRMCIDKGGNQQYHIVKYRFPIPRLDDMLDELCGAKLFSKIDHDKAIIK
ncbi:uncharacterized protein LOC141637716 [Silene latifolia]|uniref:uncharacterized protein LOC141637716 n=1 Tax=Silene latifolia TaxID=37657 RepID=UPI003D76AE36